MELELIIIKPLELDDKVVNNHSVEKSHDETPKQDVSPSRTRRVVYLVMRDYDECTSVLSVYSNKNRAYKECRRLKRSARAESDYNSSYYVSKFGVR